MTTTADGTARAAAQLREAARDVAMVAERRSRRATQPETAQWGVGTRGIKRPGRVMRLVAARLAAAGFEAVQEDGGGGSQLDIGCAGARCTAWAGESGHAEWEWHPEGTGWAAPKQAADLATVLLTGTGSDLARRGDGYDRPGITFKGIVAAELAARGLDVRLSVYPDQRNYDVTAEVVVTCPASAGTGTVYVTDSGTLTWACDYWDEAAAGTPPPGGDQPDGEPEAAMAVVISRTLIRAMVQAGLAPDSKVVRPPEEPT
jgi:hypothetical protein